MQSGNFAEAQLRALIDVAAVAAGANRLEEVLELAAERSLAAVGGASLSISRWDAENGILHTLVNVGDVADWEERFPAHEVYSVAEYPSLQRLMSEGEYAIASIDDPRTDPSQRELLRTMGKESSLAVKMILEGQPWGELEVHTGPGAPRASKNDVEFLRAIADQLVGAVHRAELFAQIEELAYTDSLTGVASRRAVERALEEAWATPAGPGSPALILCDIDDLKRVNDQGGHEAGDRALCGAAEALVHAARRHSDAVVGRFGGDEFCVLLPSGTVEDARAVATDAVQSLRAAGGERISCGVAARADGEEPRGPAPRGRRGPVPREARGRLRGRGGRRRSHHRAARAARPRPRLPRERLGRRARARSARHARRDERHVGRGAAGPAARSPGAGELSTPDLAIRRPSGVR